MIPNQQARDIRIIVDDQPTLTYRLDGATYRIHGMIDGQEAMIQAIAMILDTERYEYPIYSHNYGVELRELIGQDEDYARPEAERRIREALLQDDRITAVHSFRFPAKKRKDALAIAFSVDTIFGAVDISKEVQV